MPIQSTCKNCGYISSSELCKACIMLDGLNRGRPELSIGKNNKRKKILKMTAKKTNGHCSNGNFKSSESNNRINAMSQNVQEMF